MSPSKELRDASNEAEILVRDYGVEASMRLDVFKAKLAAEENIKTSGEKLGLEEQRLVDKMILDGKRAGLALPEKEREELTMRKKELSQACLEFSVSIYSVCMCIRSLSALRYSEKFQRGECRGLSYIWSVALELTTNISGCHFFHAGRSQRCSFRCDFRVHETQ